MTPPVWLASLAAVIALSSCSGADQPDESAQQDEAAVECLAPRLELVAEQESPGTPPTVVVGEPVTISGDRFVDGCLREDATEADVDPLDQIRIVILQGSQTVSVAQTSARGDDHGFELTFGLPAGLTAGPAQISAQSSLEPGDPSLATIEVVVEQP